MDDLDNITKEFLAESLENLDQLDRDLVTLEGDPQDQERLANIFRTVHTIKGTCGFFNFGRLGAVAHAGESLLSRLRDQRLVLNPEITSGLLDLVDTVREILANIEATGAEGYEDYGPLIAKLTRLQTAESGVPTEAAAQPRKTDEASPRQSHPDTAPEGTIRVSVGLLDKLMNLAGELVLTRNQILQLTSTQGDAAVLNTSQRLNLITSELQDGVMKTRMQPIGNTWNKFPRLVRDLAQSCGKQVVIEMEGKETELDKTIVEAIKDPLIHLVRNAVSHGIESPAVRQAQGKPPEGRLQLRAYHESGQVNIVVTDDGGGIDVERIKRGALQRNLITHEQADHMSERELVHLIFLPGFSTAEQITDVSGRGVGMDVVQTNIEKIGGTVDVQSHAGHSTTIKLKIPLTLAIIPALIVTSGRQPYVISQVSLLKLIRLEGEDADREIEIIHGAPVYRFRGNLLPLVYLNRELRNERRPNDDHQPVNIVVLQADDRQFGLIVDSINDTEEIVVKPLAKSLKSIPVFAGATILGDGQVALILDVLGIAQTSGVISEMCDRSLIAKGAPPHEQQDSTQSVLLLELNGNRRLAVPLITVARLVEIPHGAVDKAAHQEVAQFCGQILPLVRLSRLFPEDSPQAVAQTNLQVVICADKDRSIGLVVDRVLDIVATTLDVEHFGSTPGIIGSAIIQQHVTHLLDVPQIIASAEEHLLQPSMSA